MELRNQCFPEQKSYTEMRCPVPRVLQGRIHCLSCAIILRSKPPSTEVQKKRLQALIFGLVLDIRVFVAKIDVFVFGNIDVVESLARLAKMPRGACGASFSSVESNNARSNQDQDNLRQYRSLRQSGIVVVHGQRVLLRCWLNTIPFCTGSTAVYIGWLSMKCQ